MVQRGTDARHDVNDILERTVVASETGGVLVDSTFRGLPGEWYGMPSATLVIARSNIC